MVKPEQQQDLQPIPSLIVLTGFRATGKTAVGRRLADLLAYRFIDTDDVVVDRLGCSIAESVRLDGWQPFRDMERQVLQQLATETNTVIATGGGAVLHTQAWEELRAHAFVVWLRAETETILSRLRQDKKTKKQRPALSDQNRETEIPALLAEREPLYLAGSSLMVDTDNQTPVELAALIFQEMSEQQDSSLARS